MQTWHYRITCNKCVDQEKILQKAGVAAHARTVGEADIGPYERDRIPVWSQKMKEDCDEKIEKKQKQSKDGLNEELVGFGLRDLEQQPLLWDNPNPLADTLDDAIAEHQRQGR